MNTMAHDVAKRYILGIEVFNNMCSPKNLIVKAMVTHFLLVEATQRGLMAVFF